MWVNKSLTRPVIASMKTHLMAVAVAAMTLTSAAAFADDCDHDGQGSFHAAVAFNSHPTPPPATYDGHYELQSRQQFIAGHMESYTTQQCRESRHGWRRQTQCWPVTQTRWVPGSYQTVQEWVFVRNAAPPRQEYSRYPGHRPPMYGQGRAGFHVSVR